MNMTLLIITGIILLTIIFVLWQQAFYKDEIHIRKTLRQASQKNHKIGNYLTKWRLWRIWMKIRRIHTLNNQILTTLQKDHKKFPQADKFLNLYLDSTLQILQNYNTLVTQSVRNSEVQKGLADSDHSLQKIITGLETQLTTLLSPELETLQVEKEVLEKHTP